MEQSFERHAHRPTAFVIATAATLGALVCVILAWFGRTRMDSAVPWLVVVAVAYIMTSRRYTTALQDRIIRMEMLYRTDRLLTPAQRAAYATLTLTQIVAVRFASDAELPALVERAVAEHLEPKAIKRAIQHWQADLVRT